jgi:hypothetical protein
MTALQNLGLAVAPLAAAAVINKLGYASGTCIISPSHFYVCQISSDLTGVSFAAIWIFAGCSGAAVLLSVLLLLVDARNGVVLNASAADLAKRRGALHLCLRDVLFFWDFAHRSHS